MKRFLTIIASIIIASFAVACVEDISFTITIDKTLANVPCDGGDVQVKITTLMPWKAEIDSTLNSAITVTPMYGYGDGEVTIHIPATDSIYTSVSKVTFSSASDKRSTYKTIAITQQPLLD